MRITTGKIGSKQIGNFIINIHEDYFLRPSIDLTISWEYIDSGRFRSRKKYKVVYKATFKDKNLEKVRKMVDDKIQEKLPIFIQMEREGKLL